MRKAQETASQGHSQKGGNRMRFRDFFVDGGPSNDVGTTIVAQGKRPKADVRSKNHCNCILTISETSLKQKYRWHGLENTQLR
jgi:hypothetical protein